VCLQAGQECLNKAPGLKRLGRGEQLEKHHFMQGCSQGGHALEAVIQGAWREWSPKLMAMACASRVGEETAKDLLQQTFLKVWRKCAEFRGESEVLTWVRRILQFAILDHLRRAHDEQPLLDDAGEILSAVDQALLEAVRGQPLDPQALAEQAESRRIFKECFARFMAAHPQAAAAVHWAVVDEWSMDDIAAVLQRSPGATREFLSQSRKKARYYLAPWFELVSRSAKHKKTAA
jgi:RNA polymerase sigma factor (sigma-70 family)